MVVLAFFIFFFQKEGIGLGNYIVRRILNNNAFVSINEQGQEIVVMGKGIVFQKLLSCDLDGLRAAGYDVTTPVIVTNSDEYLEVVPVQQPEIKHGAQLLTIL